MDERKYEHKVCKNNEENRKGKFISITMDEVDTFLKCFEFDNEENNYIEMIPNEKRKF